MAFQYSSTLRNNQVSQLQSTVGGSGTNSLGGAGILKIFSGTEPANCALGDPSGLLVTISLPPTWLTSSGGVTTLAGTWSNTATAGGVAATFRIYDGSGVCHIQGNCSSDLQLNNTNIAINQTVSVQSFSVTASNA